MGLPGVGTMMTILAESTSYRCPICNIALPSRPRTGPFEVSCSDCGYPLWCCQIVVDDVVVLEAISGKTPEHMDIEHLCDALTASGRVRRVVVDLSDVELISSALAARLVALNKRIRAANGRLLLSGLSRFVRDTFRGSRLDRVFDVLEGEDYAQGSL